ncbi:hypothetical protein AB4K20DRAFT_1920353 [Rhizopus microsporus]|uniref:Secreted protein n=1 Tax=Rhizopus microsporus TaxID=58291 RepID=A0A1X0RSS8_RHIZD|nr:hypothetical protein BCV71DRAFT_40293 [Rhizopus microsporus]
MSFWLVRILTLSLSRLCNKVTDTLCIVVYNYYKRRVHNRYILYTCYDYNDNMYLTYYCCCHCLVVVLKDSFEHSLTVERFALLIRKLVQTSPLFFFYYH